MAQVIIIHGSGGSPTINWFPWLKEALERIGVPVTVPAFPRPERQNLSTWRATFEELVGSLQRSHILIGHSTGVALILNLLNESSVSITGTFLAAGFVGPIGSPVYDPLNATFFENKFDWPRIRRNAGSLFVYSGDNDPYVPLAKSRELALNLDGELHVIPHGGHLNHETGFTKFPHLLSDLEELMK